MHSSRIHAKRRYFLSGIVALIPLWITWLILRFLFLTLANLGEPLVRFLSGWIRPRFPALDPVLSSNVIVAILSVVFVVTVIYMLGLLTNVVVGRRLVSFFEGLLDRVPFVKDIYGSVKKLMNVLQEKPADDTQRVVLIDFPSPEMKTVGLVTRVMEDAKTGRRLAAVYVPTTPNPTNGYLEIVPVERLTPTEWSMDEAMSFIISGGAIAPKTLSYDLAK